jgi:hypothetical protein
MAKKSDKEKALKLRAQGFSYSQIKAEVKVAKSTLSVWLRDFPLSEERIRELRDNSEVRIEKTRNTKEANKQKRFDKIYTRVSKEIGTLSDREIKLCGLFLFWAEGTKARSGSVVITNTDPGMILFFLKFLIKIGVPKDKVNVKLQLYKDMDEDKEKDYWSKLLKIPISKFKKSYIKKSNMLDITYKNGYGHGTCSLMVYDSHLFDSIMSSLKYIKNSFC